MFPRFFSVCFIVTVPLFAQAPKPKLWSLQPVVKPAIPTGFTQSQNPIDAFLAAQRKAKGLGTSKRADKLTLLRRLSFDVNGLPPTPGQQDAYLADNTPDAYEKLVDQMLTNPQHGVRWARHWLDVLRMPISMALMVHPCPPVPESIVGATG